MAASRKSCRITAAAAASSVFLRTRQSRSRRASRDSASRLDNRSSCKTTGTVIFAGVEGGYGNKVEIEYWDGTVSVYGHMSQIDVVVGQQLAAGDLVGLSGNTGHSTGPHLHLEIHPNGGAAIDPAPWLHAHGLQ